MRYCWIAVAALLTGSVGNAQESTVRPEVRPYVGALLPTGDHRQDFKAATTVGMQGALELSHYLHVLGNIGWTHGHAKFGSFSEDVTHVWHYDVGAEFNLYFDAGDDMVFRPFFGLGVGARTYDYRATGQEARTCSTGYGAIGTELQIASLAFRAEARDYLNCFRSPIDGRRSTRNDVLLSLGLAYHLW